MALFDDLRENFSRVSSDTKKTIDIVKTERRIKKYSDEADYLFSEVGKIIYYSDKEGAKEAKRLSELFDDIKSIEHRIRGLEKSISTIKAGDKKNKSIIEQIGADGHKALDKKDEDLILRKTDDGIKFIRICPKCNHDNPSDGVECTECGYVFRRKRQGAQEE